MDNPRTLQQSGDELHLARELSLKDRKPPTRVPGYELQEFIGSGAYGEVWTALDRRTGRTVAIKFYLHRGGLDWSLLSREVEKLAFLFADRYVVQLLDVGWDADPPYYIMEYLEHGSLENRLAAGPLPSDEALNIFREVATGLVHAHAKGVLHCDLKPGNVLLDQDMRPRLADFGQSRFSQEQAPALGTLFYMAPEQADLKALPDAAWDVYALGALFYRMVVGVPPYRIEELSTELERIPDLEQRLAAYRKKITTSKRPSGHRHVPGVDRFLAEIIDRCLEPNPHRRYRNVQEVLDDLQQRTVRRSRRPLLILGAVGPALLLAVTTVFSWNAFDVAVANSNHAVTQRALEANRFAAQLVADRVAQQIQRRWEALEALADDDEFRELLITASEQPLESAARQGLQDYLVDARRTDQEHTPNDDANWFVNNRRGVQLARSPLDEKTIDQSFAYRDYFHGQGVDLDPQEEGIAPITEPHRSIVFRSRATQNSMVAFTVPVWSDPSDGPEREVIGIVGMTVELGHFAELQSQGRSGSLQSAVLVDLRPDWTNKTGAVVEHPHLHELTIAASPGETVPSFYLDPDRVQQFQLARELALERKVMRLAIQRKESDDEDATAEEAKLENIVEQLNDVAVRSDYLDPMSKDYGGHWLAAIEPVIAGEDAKSLRDLGWVVVVQEQYDSAVAPVRTLASQLLRRGLIGLGVVLGMVTAMWGFVMVVLNESTRRGWMARLKRSMGVASETPGTGTTNQSVSQQLPTYTAAAKTPREPPTVTN